MQKKKKNSSNNLLSLENLILGPSCKITQYKIFHPKKSLQSNLSLYGTVTSSKKSEKFHNFIRLKKPVLRPVWPKNLKTKLFPQKPFKPILSL